MLDFRLWLPNREIMDQQNRKRKSSLLIVQFLTSLLNVYFFVQFPELSVVLKI